LTREETVATLWNTVKLKRPMTSTEKPLKDEVVRMRISAEQKHALVAAANRDGLELSAWLRQLALRAAGVIPPPADRRRSK
jgi:uncharacterized protein (DUF1778 family)